MRVYAGCLMLLVACGAPRPLRLPYVVSVSPIEIRAESSSLAIEVSRAVAAALPHIQQLPGIRRFEPSDGVVCAFEETGRVACGITNERFVRLTVGIDAEPAMIRYIVAH